jgi:fimbrial chaperone protein
MRAYKRLVRFVTGFLVPVVFSAGVAASDLVVSPIKVTLDQKNSAAVITLKNAGKEARVIQTELLAWSQQDGKDVYEPTRDLLVNPPIFTLPAGRSQVIRVGLNRPPHAQQELAYRLYVQEVPPPPQAGFNGLRMALRIGLPVFVSPKAQPRPTVRWRVDRTSADMLKLTVANEGNFHIHLTDIRLTAADTQRTVVDWSKVHIYLLPGQSRTLPLKPEFDWKGQVLNLSARTGRGEVDTKVVLEKEPR